MKGERPTRAKDRPLARKFLYVIAGCIVLVLLAALGWALFQDRILRFTFVPRVAFAAPAGAIDYDDPKNWVARPGLPGDSSHYVPKGYAANPRGKVAIFYVAPTTYLARDRWNAPLDDASANARLKLFVASQASVFNGLGPIWAPRYRQAVLGTFLATPDAAAPALDVAYQDVEQAFDAFLKAVPADAPILLAGHSQGSLHLMTLLARRIAGTPTAKRIVAAYLVGWPVSTVADLPKLGLPACTTATQAGCVLSWQSFAQPADPHLIHAFYDTSRGLTGAVRGGTAMLCTNPLVGGGAIVAGADANRGSLVPDAGFNGGTMEKGLVGAGCDPSGLLMIGAPPKGYTSYVLPGQNFHVFDYALFWANVRADATARAAAFAASR